MQGILGWAWVSSRIRWMGFTTLKVFLCNAVLSLVCSSANMDDLIELCHYKEATLLNHWGNKSLMQLVMYTCTLYYTSLCAYRVSEMHINTVYSMGFKRIEGKNTHLEYRLIPRPLLDFISQPSWSGLGMMLPRVHNTHSMQLHVFYILLPLLQSSVHVCNSCMWIVLLG